MQAASLTKRLVDQWPLGLAVATGLALTPVVNWLGVILGLVVMLRHGGPKVGLGFVLVLGAAYLSLSHYSLELLEQEWMAALMCFAPLWVMAWVLRGTRSLSFALVGGFVLMMGLIVLLRLIFGPATLDEWVHYFDCRVQAAGMTQAQLMQLAPGVDFREMVRAFMIGWPLSLSLMQLGLLFSARWIQARLYYPGGFRADFYSLKMPRSLALGSAGLIVSAIFAPESMLTLWHLAILALVLMAVTGLGQIHAYLSASKRSVWWLVALYGLLFLNIWTGLFLLALYGTVMSTRNLKSYYL